MKKAFKDALDAGHIVVSTWPDGTPLVVDGVPYYQATEDGFNLSIGRFHAFGDVLRRHDELKLTDELLSTGLDALTGYFRRCRAQAQMDPEQVMDAAGEGLLVIERMQQRRGLGLSVEQLYEVASIFHFCEEDDPAAVDWTLSKRFIRACLDAPNKGDLYRFFLGSPIGSYVPLAALLDANTLNFLQEINEREILDWTRTLLTLRTTGASSGTMNTTESRRETLYGLDGLYRELLSSTTTTVPPGNVPKNES